VNNCSQNAAIQNYDKKFFVTLIILLMRIIICNHISANADCKKWFYWVLKTLLTKGS